MAEHGDGWMVAVKDEVDADTEVEVKAEVEVHARVKTESCIASDLGAGFPLPMQPAGQGSAMGTHKRQRDHTERTEPEPARKWRQTSRQQPQAPTVVEERPPMARRGQEAARG